ncbi:MAG: HNH endonuclease [Alphaproteobacteria bacterium]|jgi:hypothetical protein|nr:HNH endonuclease [Alphaproteobacteria bacterium]
MKKKRDYKKEYRENHKPNLKDNNARHRARYAAEKAGKVHKGDGKEIDHKNNNPRDNSSGNTRVMSKAANRARPRRKII